MTLDPLSPLRSLVARVRLYRRETASSLNAFGLFLTVVAAFILYLYPPRFAPAYTESGEGKVTFVNPATTEGLAYAAQWAQYAWLGPLMLIFGFGAQLVAAILDAPFSRRHRRPRHDRNEESDEDGQDHEGRRAMTDQPTQIAGQSWDKLILEAATTGGGSQTIEAIRRMVVALDQSEKSATALGGRLKTLNVWLIILTAVLVVLTVVQVYIALAGIR